MPYTFLGAANANFCVKELALGELNSSSECLCQNWGYEPDATLQFAILTFRGTYLVLNRV